ncbi:O-antigen ligase family protein [Candidatus Sumerlaeota bacterium]|nr:O-antigen ligase family protein [Candidatus Sumerlaeota bacterium]
MPTMNETMPDSLAPAGEQISEWLATSLLVLCGFTISIGPAFEQIIGVNLSRAYIVFGAALIGYWILFGKNRLQAVPLMFKLYLAFTFLYIFCTDFIFSTDGLSFRDTGQYRFRYDLVLDLEPRGIIILRYVAFILIGIAAACLINTPKRLCWVGFSISAGLCSTVLPGGHNYFAEEFMETRLAGAFWDPNDLGALAFTTIFLNLIMLNIRQWKIPPRILICALIAVECYILLTSVSRGAILAFAMGIAVMLALLPNFSRKFRFSALLIVFAIIIFITMPRSYLDTFILRLNPDFIQSTGGSNRLQSWTAYLQRFDRYWIFGVGFGLEKTQALLYDANLPKIYNPHNTYLLNLIQYGVTGLILFLAGLYHYVRQTLSRLESPRNPVTASYMALLIAWLTYIAFFDAISLRHWWFSLGIIASMQHLPKNFKPSETAGQAES